MELNFSQFGKNKACPTCKNQ